jgi:hypothetical protein
MQPQTDSRLASSVFSGDSTSVPRIATRLLDSNRAYTGVELRPHFLLAELGLRGSALGAFIGPCRVETEHLVDWEDRLANDRIEAAMMLHFIGEFFGASLTEGVLRQRLFIAQLAQALQGALVHSGRDRELRVERSGDDLFLRATREEGSQDEPRKLSVSIVTASPVSQLLHVGINIDPAGAPVAAIGLLELGIEPRAFAHHALAAFAEEWGSVEWACAKVRPVV